VEFVVDKVALGQVFFEYFSFLCQFSFHLQLHIQHHVSSGAGAMGQAVAEVPSALSLTPPQESKKEEELPRAGNVAADFNTPSSMFGLSLTRF
jgi:hypothetical protein